MTEPAFLYILAALPGFGLGVLAAAAYIRAHDRTSYVEPYGIGPEDIRRLGKELSERRGRGPTDWYRRETDG